MKKRIPALVLALLMLLPAASCSETTTAKDDEAEASTETATTAETTEQTEEVDTSTMTDREIRQSIPDNLPDNDYNGQTFAVLCNTGEDYTTEIAVDELTGDNCNDAVYNRNMKIEDRFNVKITVTENDSPHSYTKTIVQSGITDYQIVSFKDYLAYSAINNKTLLNWYDIPYVDLTQPWHNSLANDNATINGILYAAASDLSTTSLTYTHAMFVNQALAADYGYPIDTLYSLVLEGQWTLDKMMEITGSMYSDLNGNGEKDKDDQYGCGYYYENNADVWVTALGGDVVKVVDGTSLEIDLMTDKNVAALEKLVSWENEDGFFKYTTSAKEEETHFLNGLLVTTPLRLYAAFNTLREMEDDYSILPYPKWDEAQEAYYTNADDKFSVFGVPLTSDPQKEFIGVIYEALCAESYKNVYPEYYDTALKGKYSSDQTTAEIVDLIVAGRKFDFSFQFGESYFQRLCYMFRDQMLAGTDTLASAYAKLQKALNKSITNKLLPLYGIEKQ